MELIEELKNTWRTFRGGANNNGWQLIPVTSFKNCYLMAGMELPGSKEGVLFNFLGANIPRVELLPNGKGFNLRPILIDGKSWISLTKTEEGIAELFISMLENIFKLLQETDYKNGDTLLHLFLDRVAAWQDFMSKGLKPLSIESQTGLYGELTLLKNLLDLGLKEEAVKTWDGPLNGLQDFHIGFGAIEVKSTISQDGFIAKIGSLDQLSDSVYKPIYLVGQKLAISPNGKTLPALVHEIQEQLVYDLILKNSFDSRLMRYGYIEEHSSAYDRNLILIDSLMFEVNGDFPKLTPELVNPVIRSAKYEIEISGIPSMQLNLSHILKSFGVNI